MREIANITARLVLIMAVAAVLLGFTSSLTSAPIAAQEAANKTEMRKAVLEGAAEFEDLNAVSGQIQAVFRGKGAAGETLGYVFELSAAGFGGPISMSVGVRAGQVSGVRIATHSETPGLGANAANQAFLSQFEGKSGVLRVIKAGSPGESEIMAITAATITSKAVAGGINEALAYYEAKLK
ncbi:MAG: RnfABCDGE type electron transport complex subunit G [Christensenellaceae bacterium]|nr:RnfABCDGE type electron transport complex subunit G [Christensenellaceae bacterium]